MYKVECPGACPKEDACVVVLDDESVCRISPPENGKLIVEEGLQACGYLHDRKVVSISFNPEQCMKGMIERKHKKRLTNERDKNKLNIVRNA